MIPYYGYSLYGYVTTILLLVVDITNTKVFGKVDEDEKVGKREFRKHATHYGNVADEDVSHITEHHLAAEFVNR